MSDLNRVNELVLRFANVNGSGSASANSLIAKSFFRMGLPVGPKNIFPSNIQGLPTWYEIRVSEKGHTGRRGSVDVLVAMNSQTFQQDVADVVPGGYLVYDSTKPLNPHGRRDDINYIGLPLTQITVAKYEQARHRQLFKNIIYAGALSALLGIEFEVLCDLLGEQFKGRDKIIETNIDALQTGYDYAAKFYDCPLPLRVERRDLVGDKILIDGNSTVGLGAVYAGATVAGWYPITPSTSVIDAYTKYAEKLRIDPQTGRRLFGVAQAEDELAAIGMVIGANWNGARAFTATSGPGISLMSEFLGLAYYAEIPAVLVDVQRCGPSTGMPTRNQQSDLMACAYASHGDSRHVLLLPSTPKECFDFSMLAFDLAERLQTPVILVSELELGMNDSVSEPLTIDPDYSWDRGKVANYEMLEEGFEFYRYLDIDGDGIPYRTYPGTHPTKGAFFTRGSGHNKYGGYTEKGPEYQENMERLLVKFRTAATLVPPAIIEDKGRPDAVLFFGTTAEVMPETLEELQRQGHLFDQIRLRSFPFGDEVWQFINSHERVLVIEQNRDAQMRSMLMIEGDVNPAKLISVTHYDGMPVTAEFLVATISGHVDNGGSRQRLSA
ncbi:MAG: 2-oxoacid:acceptor oxidoreductase subunit alpha [Gammaproteobacteria bacterium]|nr:MAG: 2-oxoacid:acceptor oxidoreductase subunit alpha [Gammaproteobacteria bacterium]RLA13771.1 MAG: 2-oxoacid:acceptor oxidoreductase subunit alpha [Gammaproteobacteria bacterium]